MGRLRKVRRVRGATSVAWLKDSGSVKQKKRPCLILLGGTLHSTVHYSTAQCITVQYSTVHYSTVPAQPLPVALHQVQHVRGIRQPGRELVLVDVVVHQGPPHTKVFLMLDLCKSIYKVLPSNDRQKVALNTKL